MPNYCENVLTVTGPYEDMMTFFNRFSRGGDFKMRNLILPHSDSYISRIQSWGSKWDISDTSHSYEEIRLKFEGYEDDSEEEVFQTIFYNTPWGPNETFIKNVSGMFESLIFALGFYEPGQGFAGQSTFCNGEVIEHIYYEKDLKYEKNDINTLCLAIDLDLESADYVVNQMYDEDSIKDNPKVLNIIKHISKKYNIDIHYEDDNNGGLLNLTSKLIEISSLPDPD